MRGGMPNVSRRSAGRPSVCWTFSKFTWLIAECWTLLERNVAYDGVLGDWAAH